MPDLPIPSARTGRPLSDRLDLRLIAQMVEPRSRVLDIGCGDGTLLDILVHEREVDGRGIEIDMGLVTAAVGQGLSVIHGDADTDLTFYPDQAFDYVILSRTLQATERPREVLHQMLRIGRRAIVSFPNFGHWLVRLKLLVSGRMPRTAVLDRPWYDTPNIHLCTILDFFRLCEEDGYFVELWMGVDGAGRKLPWRRNRWLANIFAEQGLFLLSKKQPK
ncbi:methionine biosynthesis protein MetW [Elioraea thermophila]|uniref:methionine biosynthesis protein MetW n=1 Tax=Elioraea thermophila TaxID=2185104 RepID=UPI000DF1807F|nr:methionine biosynthesis protein MetW [Elioraea thermophila]